MTFQSYTPVQMIEKLVGFDTTSRNSNLELIDWVQDYLKPFGARFSTVHDATGKKANLIATVGPEGDGGIILSGHTDVVPVDGQDWHTDPWVVTEKAGKLYGRGTSDMKSFIAIGLALVPEFMRRGIKTPLHFALSYDEEVGCLGVEGIIRHLRAEGVRPAAAIVGEPTEMQVINAHKGGHIVQTIVRGLEGHSSQPDRGVNAVMIAADLIHHLNGVAKGFRTGPLDARFDPPWSTMQTNMIQGGSNSNILAGHCSFISEMRMLPGISDQDVVDAYRKFAFETVLPGMKAVSDQAAIRIETLARIPGLRPDPENFAETLTMALVGANHAGAVAFGTEAGSFQELGIPTIICGPGSIKQAHTANEFIKLAQVEKCVTFMHKLADRMAAGL